MNWIKTEQWKTKDGFTLEKEAMDAVISNQNTLIVAGPGAGKTELLAQRACFLLETNTAKHPKKILAISFKKDAAENLKDRVELRCGKELSSRFESKTYDAFAKEILDRFRNSLIETYKPLKAYGIANEKDVKKAFILSGVNPNFNNRLFKSTYINRLSNNKLPLEGSSLDQVFIEAWDRLVHGDDENNLKSSLTFQMISRLAEYLIRSNPYIRRAIEMTYSHLFLDEFQDTTTVQYELVKTCFLNSVTVITAVGDSKQRIMLWAGARKTIFDEFITEFNGLNRKLVMNHRSAPRLVEIQKSMYKLLGEDAIDLQTNAKWSKDDGEAYLRVFDNYVLEAEIICSEVKQLVNNGVKLNEICILVKQQVDIYGQEIINKLSDCGIKARNEAVYQDLLKEDIVKTLVSLFRSAISDKSPDDWEFLYYVLSEVNGIDENTKPKVLNDFINKIDLIITDLKEKLKQINKEEFFKLVDYEVENISYGKFASIYQQYQSKEYFDDLVENFKSLVWNEFNENSNWISALDNFEGKNSIPVMTIHKSKGLEYDTIFFVGLEDAAFWNFNNQPDEDRCAFFVALSRAKRRIDFTFSAKRPTGFTTNQKHSCINEFYELFDDGDIVEQVDYNSH